MYKVQRPDGLTFHMSTNVLDRITPKSSIDKFQEQIEKANENIARTQAFITETQAKISFLQEIVDLCENPIDMNLLLML